MTQSLQQFIPATVKIRQFRCPWPGSSAQCVVSACLHPFLRTIVLTIVLASVSSVSGFVHSADHPQQGVVVNKIVVTRGNIFDGAESEAAMQIVASGINRFHKTTLESVILREIGVAVGDTLEASDVSDVERRLRRLGIFAAVSAKLVTAADGVELRIDTRDNFSIIAGASGSYLGGVGNVGFSTGDKNLFGTGNELLLGLSRTTTDNFRGSLTFNDLHFFDKPWRAKYRIGRTDEGDFFGVNLSDPFRSLTDTNAWSLNADKTERFIKYYQAGDTVVQIPIDRVLLSGSYTFRSGSDDQYLRRGLVGSVSETKYSQASGVSAESIDVPSDNQTLYLGGLIARDSVSNYVKAQGLDTLNFVQDLTLGSSAQLQLGVNSIEETDASSARYEPIAAAVLTHSLAANQKTFLKFSLAANTSIEESGDNPWSATIGFRAYYTGISRNTLAARVEYSTGEDGPGLPVQLTLGENNGLRGYDARQFEGRQRGRINIESRYHTGWKLSVFDVGIVGFVDSGWAASRSESSLSIKHSVGAGLRFGSNALLGGKVIRLDVAVPLDPPVGENSDPRMSFAVGQVFRF